MSDNQSTQARMDMLASYLGARATYITGTEHYGIAGGKVMQDGVTYQVFARAMMATPTEMYLEFLHVEVPDHGRFVTSKFRTNLKDNELGPLYFTVSILNQSRMTAITQHVFNVVSQALARNQRRVASKVKAVKAYDALVQELMADTSVVEPIAREVLDFATQYAKSKRAAYEMAIKLIDAKLKRMEVLDSVIESMDELTRDLYNDGRNSSAKRVEKAMSVLGSIDA